MNNRFIAIIKKTDIGILGLLVFYLGIYNFLDSNIVVVENLNSKNLNYVCHSAIVDNKITYSFVEISLFVKNKSIKPCKLLTGQIFSNDIYSTNCKPQILFVSPNKIGAFSTERVYIYLSFEQNNVKTIQELILPTFCIKIKDSENKFIHYDKTDEEVEYTFTPPKE